MARIASLIFRSSERSNTPPRMYSRCRNRLRASCCVIVLAPARCPVSDVLDGGHQDARDAQAEVLLEVGVLGGDDGLAQHRRDVVVADDDAPLGGELADDARRCERGQAGDGVRAVVVERADLREVVGEGEEHAADGARGRRRRSRRATTVMRRAAAVIQTCRAVEREHHLRSSREVIDLTRLEGPRRASVVRMDLTTLYSDRL